MSSFENLTEVAKVHSPTGTLIFYFLKTSLLKKFKCHFGIVVARTSEEATQRCFPKKKRSSFENSSQIHGKTPVPEFFFQ